VSNAQPVKVDVPINGPLRALGVSMCSCNCEGTDWPRNIATAKK
jgi:hypothetical protein